MKHRLLALIALLTVTITAAAQEKARRVEITPADAVTLERLTDAEAAKFSALVALELQARTQAQITAEAGAYDLLNAKLVQLYKEAAESPRLSRYIIAYHLSEFIKRRESAKSAAQVSQVADEVVVKFLSLLTTQNAVIIEQNQKVIALLERVAGKR